MNQVVSIIVPTKNRCSALRNMVRSVLEQTVIPSEIIIIDQSDNIDSKIMLSEFDNAFEVKKLINLVYIYDQAITGSAQARNRALEKSKGNIIFFLDDDVVLDPDYTEKILKTYDDYPEVAGVGGVVTNVTFSKFKKIELFNSIFHRGAYKDIRRKMYLNYEKLNKSVKSNKISGCCASYKREVLEDKSFDEVLDTFCNGYAFGEDIDLSMRLSKRHKIVITPFARLAHYSESINTHRNSQVNLFYLEVFSYSFIFHKLLRKNIIHRISFFWLCFGLFLRVLLGLLRKNKSFAVAFFKGFYGGKELAHEANNVNL